MKEAVCATPCHAMPHYASCSWMCNNLQAQLFAHLHVHVAAAPGWVRWGELPTEYFTAVEAMNHLPHTCRWSLHQGEPHRSFLPKCLTVLVNQAVESADKIMAARSPTQSSPFSQIPEPPPSILEAHTVLHTETYICGMTEAIKSADNFQQICICCCCCCLYKWFLVNYKYKNQGPK